MVKSAWVSTAIALILTIPPLGMFMAIFQTAGNLPLGAAVGFGLHFLLIAVSTKISSALRILELFLPTRVNIKIDAASIPKYGVSRDL